jgi:hypothetical protein
MKHAVAALAVLLLPGIAAAHGHPGNVAPDSADAWKYQLCGEMAAVAIQSLHDRDKGRAPKTYADDGTRGPAIANIIIQQIFTEPQISSPKKAETFGRAFCMERLRQERR